MLMGPWALTMFGTATVAAAPAAATFRKRRRVACLSLPDLLTCLSPVRGRAHATAVIYCRQDKGLRAALATRLRDNATLRRSRGAPNINGGWRDLFRANRNKFPNAPSRSPAARLVRVQTASAGDAAG